MNALDCFRSAARVNEAAESHWRACREAQSFGDWKEAQKQARLAKLAEASQDKADKLLRHGL